MKKFTLMIIAALMAVTANAQKLERAQLARPMQNRVSMTASPMQSKVNSVTRPMQGKTQSVETIKQIKKARKAAAVSSIDDLTGMRLFFLRLLKSPRPKVARIRLPSLVGGAVGLSR